MFPLLLLSEREMPKIFEAGKKMEGKREKSFKTGKTGKW